MRMKPTILSLPWRNGWNLLPTIVIAFTLIGCGATSPPALLSASPAKIVTTASVDRYGGAINLRFDSIPPRQRTPSAANPALSDRVYQLSPGEALRGDLRLLQTYPDPKRVRLMLLLNYRQVPFQVDNQVATNAFEADLRPGLEANFHLATQQLARGYYDFALIVVVDPHNTLLDGRTRFRTKETPVLRRSLYVGTASPPTVTYEPLTSTMITGHISDLLMLTEQPQGLDLWPGRHVAPGERLNLFVRTSPLKGNVRAAAPAETAVPIALVAFMDDHVVPIGTAAVVYAAVRPGEIGTLPITVTAPLNPGVHQYFVHQFPNPYVDATLTGSGDHSFYSQSTQRIVLTVDQP